MIDDLETRLAPLRGDWLGAPTPVSQLAARARRQRGLRWARRSAAGLVLLVAVAGLVWGRLGDGAASPQINVAGGGAKAIFVPPTHAAGDETRLPLTFFDGTRLELVYPRGARLAQGGFVPGADAGISASATGGRPLPGRTIVIRYGTVTELTQEQPTKTYPGVNGTTVGLYPSVHLDTRFPPLDVLGFQFGHWALFVEDLPPGFPNGQKHFMTDTERSIWASHLGGHVTADGFLVLDPTAPLTLGGSDQPVGVIGDEHPGSTQVLFQGCIPKVSGSARWVFVRRDDRGSLFCLSDHGVSIRVNASAQAATRIVRGISVRGVRPGTVESIFETPASPTRAAGVECPQAREPLSGSPDGLPVQGQTALARVQAIKASQEVRIRRRFPAIVSLTVEPRNGEVWRRDGTNVVTVQGHDYWVVARLRHPNQCPKMPWTWDGVPLRFVVIS